MNLNFHDSIGKGMEVYIDEVVKSANMDQHLADLEHVLLKMRFHGLKMNPAKCAIGVSTKNFLRFIVQQKGIEVDKNKAKAVLEASLPQNKEKL